MLPGQLLRPATRPPACRPPADPNFAQPSAAPWPACSPTRSPRPSASTAAAPATLPPDHLELQHGPLVLQVVPPVKRGAVQALVRLRHRPVGVLHIWRPRRQPTACLVLARGSQLATGWQVGGGQFSDAHLPRPGPRRLSSSAAAPCTSAPSNSAAAPFKFKPQEAAPAAQQPSACLQHNPACLRNDVVAVVVRRRLTAAAAAAIRVLHHVVPARAALRLAVRGHGIQLRLHRDQNWVQQQREHLSSRPELPPSQRSLAAAGGLSAPRCAPAAGLPANTRPLSGAPQPAYLCTAAPHTSASLSDPWPAASGRRTGLRRSFCSR